MKLSSIPFLLAGALLAGCATLPADKGAEKIDISRFSAVKVAPVQFTSELAGTLPGEERASLEQDFTAALKEGLPHPLATEQEAAGAVRIEVTITELNASSPTVNLLTTALLFVPFDAGGIAFQARFYDGDSRDPFAQTTYRHTSTPLELNGSFRRYGHAAQSLRGWAEDLTSGLAGAPPRKVAKED